MRTTDAAKLAAGKAAQQFYQRGRKSVKTTQENIEKVDDAVQHFKTQQAANAAKNQQTQRTAQAAKSIHNQQAQNTEIIVGCSGRNIRTSGGHFNEDTAVEDGIGSSTFNSIPFECGTIECQTFNVCLGSQFCRSPVGEHLVDGIFLCFFSSEDGFVSILLAVFGERGHKALGRNDIALAVHGVVFHKLVGWYAHSGKGPAVGIQTLRLQQGGVDISTTGIIVPRTAIIELLRLAVDGASAEYITKLVAADDGRGRCKGTFARTIGIAWLYGQGATVEEHVTAATDEIYCTMDVGGLEIIL